MIKEKSPTGQGKGSRIINKDKKFSRQIQTVTESWAKLPGTMLEIAHRNNIERANVCRYVSALRKSERIYFIGKGYCSVSKHIAGFYTTDYDLFIELTGGQNNG
ncbi:MAG: hypothetical protein H6541_10065 [Lentimicrobiaceae bacterium]|nr:hypothetical protein [Lentimicrobiaceae bacterium]